VVYTGESCDTQDGGRISPQSTDRLIRGSATRGRGGGPAGDPFPAAPDDARRMTVIEVGEPRRKRGEPLMAGMSAIARLARVETKLLVREPGSIFTIVIPLFILVVFGMSLTPGDTVLLPMTLAIGVGLVALYMVPTTLATYRERGILRRLSATPLRPGALLAVQLLLQLVLAVAGSALLLVVAGAFLGAALPSGAAGAGRVALVFVLGTAAMFAIGLLIAALAPNGRSANGIGVLLYFPMAYLAGMMQPEASMPAVLARLGGFTPLGAFRRALQDVWAGVAPQPLQLGIMAGYAVIVSLAAARFFRWE
jgi:ABC-2 type transport system permease protein